jgi:hypothetical protein
MKFSQYPTILTSQTKDIRISHNMWDNEYWPDVPQGFIVVGYHTCFENSKANKEQGLKSAKK